MTPAGELLIGVLSPRLSVRGREWLDATGAALATRPGAIFRALASSGRVSGKALLVLSPSERADLEASGHAWLFEGARVDDLVRVLAIVMACEAVPGADIGGL